MKHLANVELVICRNDSIYVPFSLEEVRDITPIGSMDSEDGLYQICEELQLLRTDQIYLPESIKTMGHEKTATMKAELWGRWFDYDTDCGREYDAEFEFRNEQVQIA